MAWPYDARNVSYGALQQVVSVNLNEIQDKVIDVFEQRYYMLSGVFSQMVTVGGAEVRGWEPDSNGDAYFCTLSSEDFAIPVDGLSGLKIVQFEIKMLLKDSAVVGAGDPVIALRYKDVNFAVSGGSPGGVTTHGSGATLTRPTGSDGYVTGTETGLSLEITDEIRVYLMSTTNTKVGDGMIGARALCEPIKPT